VHTASTTLFGAYGLQFQQLRQTRLEQAARFWEERFQQTCGGMPWDSAVETFFDVTGFWYDSFVRTVDIAVSRGAVSRALVPQMRDLWPRLAQCVPSMDRWESLSPDCERRSNIKYVGDCLLEGYQVPLASELSKWSFATYTGAEIDYLVEHHSTIFESGAGSGYLADFLAGKDCDVVAVDNGEDDDVYGSDNYFRQEAGRRGIYYCGDSRKFDYMLGDDRTLLIAWPTPGSELPSLLVKSHREKGGRYFIFKQGGFISGVNTEESETGDVPAPHSFETPWCNIAALYRELGAHWRLVQNEDVPAYDPYAYSDNMWVFKRR